jgi:hypothetical protein
MEPLCLNSICVQMLHFCVTFIAVTYIFNDSNKIYFCFQHSLLLATEIVEIL